MNKYSFFAAAASVLLMVSCGGGAYQSAAGVEVPAEVKAGEVAFSMVAVPGDASQWERPRQARKFPVRRFIR